MNSKLENNRNIHNNCLDNYTSVLINFAIKCLNTLLFPKTSRDNARDGTLPTKINNTIVLIKAVLSSRHLHFAV